MLLYMTFENLQYDKEYIYNKYSEEIKIEM